MLHTSDLKRLAWLAAGAVAFLIWATFATTIVSPVVVDDEVLFLITGVAGPRLAAAQRLHAAVQPSGALLYPALLHGLATTGLPLEAAAKVVNAALFTGTALALARMSRPLDGAERSLLLGAALLSAPLGTYAAYIMPECLYFALVSGAVMVVVSGREAGDRFEMIRGCLAAALLAAATLVKPHGLLVVAAFVAALIIRSGLRRRWKAGLLEAAAAAAAAAAAYSLLRTMSAPVGLAGRDLLGPAYRAQLAAGWAVASHVVPSLRLMLDYLLAVASLLAPSIAALGSQVADLRTVAWAGAEGRARTAGLWVFGLLGVLLILVPTTLAGEPDKLHLRYLNFLFPIILALAARLGPSLSRRRARITAVVWFAAAVGLVLERAHLRPLAASGPDIFFLYEGPEFGKFGLQALSRPFLLAAVGAGAVFLWRGGGRWITPQVLVLLGFAAVAIPNAWHFDRSMASSMAADRRVGKAAREVCGPGPSDIVALGTPSNFVPLYAALAVLKRPAPLERTTTPESVRVRMSFGACLLTTVPVPEPRWEKLAGSAAVQLYRAR